LKKILKGLLHGAMDRFGYFQRKKDDIDSRIEIVLVLKLLHFHKKKLWHS
jgi:hypothetical protein